MEVYGIVGGGLLLFVLALVIVAKLWGKSSAEAEVSNKEASNARDANEIHEENSTLTDKQLDDKLLYRDK